jgi:hypothetical protein
MPYSIIKLLKILQAKDAALEAVLFGEAWCSMRFPKVKVGLCKCSITLDAIGRPSKQNQPYYIEGISIQKKQPLSVTP